MTFPTPVPPLRARGFICQSGDQHADPADSDGIDEQTLVQAQAMRDRFGRRLAEVYRATFKPAE